MRDDTQTLSVTPTLEEGDVYPFVRVGLIVVGGLVLIGLAALLPGLGELFGWLPVSVSAILLAVASGLVIAGLLAVSPAVERLVRRTLDGPDGVVDDAGASAKFLVIFIAVAVAHRGFGPALLPLTERVAADWVYHAAFLVCALVPLVLIARRLYRSLDPLAELLTRVVLPAKHSTEPSGTDVDGK